ncbi:Glutathione S-transferase Mu 1 [Camelus dromedarius]|uniref:glutathione transferase n=1 Tax=Camelus dromedarius TaxID=9838 RepID=A0A5N4DUD2_CAMDR|nr:Glutathione S-transferase Mu 1 [Camelus dromedarius]
MGDAPDYDRSHWLNEKFKLGLDFPNLPYLMMGLTGHPEQRHRSLHARKHNMCGETEEEKIRVDVFENQVWMCASNGQAVLSPDFLTFVDFLAYDVLDVYRIFEPKCLDEFPNLKDFMSCLR